MKLAIRGVEYDYQAATTEIGLKHLYDLKLQGGIGMRAVAEALQLLDSGLRAEEDETPMQQAARAAAIQEDERLLLGMTGLVFICKRHAGETVTFDEAGEFSLTELRFVPGAVDLEPLDPPQALAAEPSQPAGGEPKQLNESPGPKASPKKAKTSKPKSPPG